MSGKPTASTSATSTTTIIPSASGGASSSAASTADNALILNALAYLKKTENVSSAIAAAATKAGRHITATEVDKVLEGHVSATHPASDPAPITTIAAAHGGAGVSTPSAPDNTDAFVKAMEKGKAFLDESQDVYAAIAAAATKAGYPTSREAVVTALEEDRELSMRFNASIHAPLYKHAGDAEAAKKHLEVFNAFVKADDDDEGATLVHAACDAGGDANASIINVENLLTAANNAHAEMNKNIIKYKAVSQTLQARIIASNPVPKLAGESDRVHESRVADFKRSLESLSPLQKAMMQQRLDEYSTNCGALQKLSAMAEKAGAEVYATLGNIKDLNKGYTPMHIASANGLIKTMQALFEHGGDVNAQALLPTKDQYEAKYAQLCKTLPYAKLLRIVAGEEKVVTDDSLDALIATPIILAADIAHTPAMKWLIEHGARLTKVTAAHYAVKVATTSQNPNDLLNWARQHALDETDANHPIYDEAYQNLTSVTIVGDTTHAFDHAA